MMKLKARLAPRLDSPTKWIWEVRALQFGEDGDSWRGRDFYSMQPPFYKLKAVTNSKSKTIHFAYNDPNVPDSMKGSSMTFSHKSAIEIIEEAQRITVWWDKKPVKLVFEDVDTEVSIKNTNGKAKRPDLLCKLTPNSDFEKICGSDRLIIEFKNTNGSSISKQAFYRSMDVAAIEINIGDSPTAMFEAKLRKKGMSIPPDRIEQSYEFLSKHILNRSFNFKILHFPSMKNKRYEESKTTSRAKSTAFGSEK